TFLSFYITRSQGREVALQKLDEVEQWAREIGDQWALSRTLNVQGIFLTDFTVSVERYHAALSIAREIGDQIGVALITGNVTTMLTDPDEINALLSEALEIHQALGNRFMAGQMYFQQGGAYMPQGRPYQAKAKLEKAVAIFEEMVAPNMVGYALEYLSDLAWGMGELA